MVDKKSHAGQLIWNQLSPGSIASADNNYFLFFFFYNPKYLISIRDHGE